MLSATRIFFERTTKFTQTVSSLGNVYRNSKWTDLSVQNIKLGGVQQFLTLFGNLVIFTCLIFLVFRGYFSNLRDILFLLTNILYVIQDFTYYLILIMASLFYSLTFKINLFLSGVLPSFFRVGAASGLNSGSFGGKTYNTKPTNINSGFFRNTDYNLGNNTNKHSDMLLTGLFLQKTLTPLPKLDYTLPLYKNSISKFPTTGNYNNNLHIILHNASAKKLLVRTTMIPTRVYELEGGLLGNYLNNDFSKINTLSLNYESLFNLDFNNFKVLSDNISTNLLLGKQARWFWKSTLLSDKFSLGVLPITNLKKLYGNSQYNNNSTGYNTWNSNRLTSQKNFFKVSNLLIKSDSGVDFTKAKTPLLYNNIISFNSYETSISWLIKKFSFLNSNKTNQTYVDFNLVNAKNVSPQGINYRGENFSGTGYFFFSNYYFQKGFALDLSGTTKARATDVLVEQGVLNSTNELFSTTDMEFVRYISITTLPYKNSTLYYSNIDLA